MYTVSSSVSSKDNCSSMTYRIRNQPGEDPEGPFAAQRRHQERGPLMNSEFYTGWIDHWGQNHSVVNSSKLANVLFKLLSRNASVNLWVPMMRKLFILVHFRAQYMNRVGWTLLLRRNIANNQDVNLLGFSNSLLDFWYQIIPRFT